MWKWPKALRVRHINLWFALLFSLTGAIVIVIFAAWLLALQLSVSTQRTSPTDLIRLALTIAAGVGGVVALVVAYRRQRDLEQGRFVEAFGAAAKQLGDSDVAVRLAGVYAMAGVADQSSKLKQQQCIDVLCGYLRLPYSPELGNNHQSALVLRKAVLPKGGAEEELQFQYRQNDKVVRQTLVRVIVAHLQQNAPHSWSSNNFDFSGAHFEESEFEGATFSGDDTTFSGATFSGGYTSFFQVAFNGGFTMFDGAVFSSETTDFKDATFSGKTTMFNGVTFNSETTAFDEAVFSGKNTLFEDATFSGKNTSFSGATFRGKNISFSGATFNGEITRFWETSFEGETTRFWETSFKGETTLFDKAAFSGETTSFEKAAFSGETTSFEKAAFSGETTSFSEATFCAEYTTFQGAAFSGKTTSFRDAAFSGEYHYFTGASFNSKYTSFLAARFGRADSISFEDPLVWSPAPVFDWDDPTSDAAIPRPENVHPWDWPPSVRSEEAS
ncbi:pentapeptide repeat-containing protein [uncultured Arthrobacter sp.]|uniref:pentapeptide repeat-containing protein n=1 Tax=uncultured Arthrobacter sp. TaxID=114050 RepID=UPI002614327F|nr:pentapeptide repeat-containing protein [uncultured Arthrobacter sp.]